LSPDYLVGFDSGTQSVKTVVFDEKGNTIGQGHRAHKISVPKLDWAEQDPEDWWEAFRLSLREALRDAKISSEKVSAVAMTHQRSTLVVVDEECHPLLPAQVWHDSRSVEQVRWTNEKFGGDRYMKITGCMPDTTWWGQKIMWVKDNEPQIFNKVCKFLTVHGFFVRRLTGEWTDSYAAPSGVLDMANLRYSSTILEAMGIPREKLCNLVPPGEVIGYISSEAARETGLPVGIPVASGAGDQQAGGLGCGVIQPNMAYLNLGTSVVLGTLSREYVAHRNFIVRAGTLPSTWNPEALLSAGCWMINWFKDNFAREEADTARKNGVLTEEILDSESQEIPAGSMGLVVQPYWLGVRQPYWDQNARGSIIGWTAGHTKLHLYRAIIEGMAYDTRLNLEGIEQALQRSIEDVRVLGGGARSRLCCQIIADVLNRTVSTMSTSEAAALGAAILAAEALKLYPTLEDAASNMTRVGSTFRPIPSHGELYNRLYRMVYINCYETLRPLLKALAEVSH
jgi:xylulokinase